MLKTVQVWILFVLVVWYSTRLKRENIGNVSKRFENTSAVMIFEFLVQFGLSVWPQKTF